MALSETAYVNGAKVAWTGCTNQNFNVTNFTYDGYLRINNISSSAQASDGDTGLLFRMTNPTVGVDAYYGYYAYIHRNGNVALGRSSNQWTFLMNAQKVGVVVGTYFHMRVKVTGSLIQVYLTDMVTPKFSVTDTTFSSGYFGMRLNWAQSSWDNVTVTVP